jgi:hypothetical protein
MKNTSYKNSLSFVILIGVLISFYQYRYFGAMQIDMLPIIFRDLDPNFLKNDFYTNVSAGFNEDFIFAKIVGWGSLLFSLPIVFFGFTILSNIGISLGGFFAARDLSKKDNLTGIIASILLITNSTFQWGNRDLIYRSELTPEHLIMPLILLAIWMGIKQRPLLVGLFAGLATFCHPLTGPGIGGLILLQIFITQAYHKQLNIRLILRLVAGGLMLFGPLILYLIPYYNSFEYRISDELFIEIMTARFPQHYLASYFLTPLKLFTGIAFIVATFFSWKKWNQEIKPLKEFYFSILPISVMLALLFLIGWLFSEVWPTRFMYTLHPFRFLLLLKVYGLIAFALYAGTILNSSATIKTKISTGIALFYPPLLLIQQVIIQKAKNIPLVLFLGYLVFFYLTEDYTRSAYEPFVLFFGLLMLFLFNRRYFQIAGLLLLAGVSFNLLLAPKLSLPHRMEKALEKRFRPEIYSDSKVSSEVELARYIKNNTPENSLLLVMPKQGRLRILANRALVVDGYGIPMNDRGLKEWWYRMNAVYNKGNDISFRHIRETYPNYMKLTDSDLIELQEEFKFNFAVIKSSIETKHSIVYENEDYKLVDFSKIES